MSFEQIINGKKYKINASPEKWAALRERLKTAKSSDTSRMRSSGYDAAEKDTELGPVHTSKFRELLGDRPSVDVTGRGYYGRKLSRFFPEGKENPDTAKPINIQRILDGDTLDATYPSNPRWKDVGVFPWDDKRLKPGEQGQDALGLKDMSIDKYLANPNLAPADAYDAISRFLKNSDTGLSSEELTRQIDNDFQNWSATHNKAMEPSYADKVFKGVDDRIGDYHGGYGRANMTRTNVDLPEDSINKKMANLIESPEEKERGWLTSPISPKFSDWIQEKTEPEEDDRYATRVGKRIGRVLGEDINTPLGAGITTAAAAFGPLGWAAKAGKLGAGALKAASSAKAVKAGKAAQVGFGGLGVSQVPELARSGVDFLKTKTPESLADTIISGTEVAGGGYLLGSAAKARKATSGKKILEDTFSGEVKSDTLAAPKFKERTVADTEKAVTRPVERARDWISEGTSGLVDKVQPLKPSSKADEKLLRQTLEVMVERQVQKTGQTPTENAVKKLRSQIVTKIGTDSNKKFAELGKIFSAQKKQLAVAREAKDTSLRLPDIEFDMDSVDLSGLPTKLRPQAKEFIRSSVTLADLKGKDLGETAKRAAAALAGKDRKAIQEAKGFVDNNISRERGIATRGAEDYGPIQVLKKDGEVTSIGISPKGKVEIEAGISKGKKVPGFSEPKGLAMSLIRSKNEKNSRFIAALSKKKGKTPEQIRTKFQQLHSQMVLVERAAEQGQINKEQARDLLGFYTKTWGKVEKSLEKSIPNKELRAIQRARNAAEEKRFKYGSESQYESKISYGVSREQKKKMDELYKKYDKIDENKELSVEERSELKNKASLEYEEVLDYNRPIPNRILKNLPAERQLVAALNRIDSIKASAQKKNLNEGDLAELKRIEDEAYSQVRSPKEESVQVLMHDVNEFGEALEKMDEVELPTWGADEDFDLQNVRETGSLDATLAPEEAKQALQNAWGISSSQLNAGLPLNLIPGVTKGWMKSIANNDLTSGLLIQGRHTLRNIGGRHLINIIDRQQADEQQLVARVSSAVDKVFAGLKKKEVNAVLQRFSEGNLDGQAEKQLLKISAHLDGLSDKYKVAKSFKKPYSPQVGSGQHAKGTPRENFIDWAIFRSQSITRAKHFTNGGSRDVKGGNSEIARAIEATDDTERARKVVNSIFASRSNSWGQASLIDGLNTIQFASYLSLHYIGNLSGNLNILLHGKKNMKSAVKSIFNRKDARTEAEAAGVLGDASSTLFSDVAAGKWGKSAAKFTLLSKAEARERTTAAKFGHITAESLWDMLKAGKLNKKGKQQLEDLILDDPDSITKLSPTHLRYARQRFSEITQGGNNPLNMPPLWAGSNAANLFLIFKRFAYQGNVALLKAIQQNPKKAIPTIAILGQLMGEAVGDLRATAIGTARGVTEAVKEGKSPLKAVPKAVKKEVEYRTDRTKFVTGSDNPVLNRVISNYMDAWVTGLFTDTLLSLARGDVSDLGGANIDFLSQGAKDASQVARGRNPFESEDTAKHWTRRVPFVSSGVAKGMWPSPSQRYGSGGRVVRERVAR